MYRAGKRIISHHKQHVVLVWFVIMLASLLVGTVVVSQRLMQPKSSIGKTPPPIINTVIQRPVLTKQFDEGVFTLALPADWRYVGRMQDVYHAYMWENTAENPGVRQLAVYLDGIPATLGVNRVLPVEAAGNKVVATTVSDNCAGFTGDKVPGSPSTPAKWAGVDFLCDLGNYERNVTGTSSPSAINSLTLTGPAGDQHKLFFVYTDNSAEPNYNIFYNLLESFRLH